MVTGWLECRASAGLACDEIAVEPFWCVLSDIFCCLSPEMLDVFSQSSGM